MQQLKNGGKLTTYLEPFMANSGYGSLSNQYFLLYDDFLAEAITMSGQVSNVALQGKINKYFNSLFKTDKDWVLAGDTDSVFVDCSEFISRFKPENPVDFLCELADGKLANVVSKFCSEIWERCNTPNNRLFFKREKVMQTVCFIGVKKRYFCYVHDNEGVRYATPKLTVTGLETNRSSTPKFCRTALGDSFKLIITRDQEGLLQQVADIEHKFKTLTMDEIASPRGVNDLEKWSDPQTICAKGTPIGVRAALVHNHFIKTKKLTGYRPIKSGGKIKFVSLVEQNPFHSNVIGWIDGAYPKELNIDQWVDRNKMFESAFLTPLKGVTEPIGWQAQPVSDLGGFFG